MGAVQVDEWGQITCTCMNEASFDGFEPCHRNGQVDDNLLSKHNDKPVFYLCGRCGNIISEDTYEIVDQLPSKDEAYDALFAAAVVLRERAQTIADRAQAELPWTPQQLLEDLSAVERVLMCLTQVPHEKGEMF